MRDTSIEVWEGRPVEVWQRLWDVPRLLVLQSTGSTNDVARRLAEQGAPAGTLVIAEHQTAGRGRLGRVWHDEAGGSLLFSLLLRPHHVDEPAPGTVPIRVGLGVVRALGAATRIEARLKWPNDVVCADRKLAGILCEAATRGGSTWIVAGVGINVRMSPAASLEFPDATSVERETMAASSRSDLVAALLAELRPLFEQPLAALDADERAAYHARDALAGREVSVASDAGPASGFARGIAPDGALLLETGGRVVRITSATIRPNSPTTSAPQRS